ncbi:uncharacterized protein LOC120331755 [Styela clava]
MLIMEESTAEETPLTPEEELDEEDIFTDSADSNLSEEKQKKVLLKYIQEKRDLQEQLDSKEKSIQEYKAKVYDLSTKIAQLEKEVSSLKKNAARIPPLANRNSNVGGRSPALNRTGVVRPSTAKKVTRTKPGKKKSNIANVKRTDSPASSSATPEPPADTKGNAILALKTLDRYQEIAKKFPELSVAMMMKAESVFMEADINHDGTIDEDELEKLIEKQGHYMTTKKEVREIMKEFDKDVSGGIDLMEYMAVMERIQQRKRTNLPPALTKSSVCTIQ